MFEDAGIKTTVITSGCVPNFKGKLKRLVDYGLKSLSMSYDMEPLGSSSKLKTANALQSLMRFKQICPDYRDVAAIATLTRTNFKMVPDTIKMLTDKGIWFLFDMIHWDRGQPGSKCKNTKELLSLLFSISDRRELVKVLNDVVRLKQDGYLVHVSESFVNELSNETSLLGQYKWNCACEDNFPAFVTVDTDGTVRPCDDFHIREEEADIKIWDLYNKWETFIETQQDFVQSYCPGCCWNTHFDAHRIKEGTIDFKDYTHE